MNVEQHPFQVWVVGGAIHAGFEAEGPATADADRRNRQAEVLGLKARYEVRRHSA